MNDGQREPLRLEEGRYYRAVDGGIHGPMIHEVVANLFKTPMNGVWDDGGRYQWANRGEGFPADLVEEVFIVDRQPVAEGVDIPRLPVGTQVNKVLGYPFPGAVVSAFHTLSGQERFVVEATGADYLGMLHIFNGDQLRAAVSAAPTPPSNVRAASLSEIRAALQDATLASYPDFVAAVTSAIDELASRRRARTYEAGHADGYAQAIGRAAGEAYRVCAETRHVTLGETAARAIRALATATEGK